MTKKNNNRRTWLDTVTLSLLTNDGITKLQDLIYAGNTLVIANTCLDVMLFQDNPEWLEEKLEAGEIVIENWLTPDQMTAKPFYWSSVSQETPAAASFEEAISVLPDKDAIMALKELLEKYGIPKGEWEQGEWAPPEPLSATAQAKLGLTEAANRTEVLKACQEKKCMDVFDEYNRGYNRGLARQHRCAYILNADGSVSEI